MSDRKTPILTLNLRRVGLPYIEAASEAKREKKRLTKCKAIKVELAALDELNSEYPSLDQGDPEALDDLNIEGEALKREPPKLHGELKKRKRDALVQRAEADQAPACLNRRGGVGASGRVVRGGYIVPRIVDPKPSIRPAA